MVAFAPDIAKDCDSCRYERPQEAGRASPVVESPRFGAYGDLSPQAWEKAQKEGEKKPRMWKESVAGRAGIRLFSRGVMGAGFYALFSWAARGHLGGYAPTINGQRYNWNQIFESAAQKEGMFGKVSTFTTHGIARIYDDIFFKPLQWAGKRFADNEHAFSMFRPTKLYANYATTGRSLGHEVVGVTYDFAGMSIGDGLGRKIADWFDPNIKHDVYDEKGHLSPWKLGKTWAYNAWELASYNAGEDWVVAPMYVAFMRGQRNIIDKISPGFGYDSDRGLCGASYKLDDHGRIIGNFTKEGVFDLQTRFTVYNIGTLMFREVYSDIAYRLDQFKKSGFQLSALMHGYRESENQLTLSSNPITAAGQLISQSVKWVMRDTIKGGLYMTPAVIPFWMARTPQHKYRGIFIHPEKGVVSFHNNASNKLEVLHANEPRRTDNRYDHYLTGDTTLFFARTPGQDFVPRGQVERLANLPTGQNPLLDVSHNNRNAQGQMDISGFEAHQRNYGFFDSMLQPMGVVTDRLRKQAHKVTYRIGKVGDYLNPQGFPGGRNYQDYNRLKTISDMYVNAAVAYTPYFFMKSDVMAKYWDTGKMDFAIEGLVDGITGLNFNQVTRGVNEVWHAMRNKSLNDPQRELEAKKRQCNDISASDSQAGHLSSRDCLEDAKKDISQVEKYQNNAESRQFLEKIKSEKPRSAMDDILHTQGPKSPSFVERQKDRNLTPDNGAGLYSSA